VTRDQSRDGNSQEEACFLAEGIRSLAEFGPFRQCPHRGLELFRLAEGLQSFEGTTAELRVSRRLVGSGMTTLRICVPWSRAKIFIVDVEFVFLSARLEARRSRSLFSLPSPILQPQCNRSKSDLRPSWQVRTVVDGASQRVNVGCNIGSLI
jgi:hypothetical protein